MAMKVGELIELLQRADPELPVRVWIIGTPPACGWRIAEVDDDATGFFIGTDNDHFSIQTER